MHRPARTTLYLRGMPVDVVREAKAAAARRGSTLASLVADMLASSLRNSHPEEPVADELAESMKWYAENREQLLNRFAGEYVAIARRSVMDHDRDFESLAKRVFARLGPRSVFMPKVQASPPRARVRSPRRSRP